MHTSANGPHEQLVISRKVGEKIMIGDIEVVVLKIGRNRIRFGINMPTPEEKQKGAKRENVNRTRVMNPTLLEARMKELGVNAKQLAAQCDLHRGTVGVALAGGPIFAKNAEKICKALQIAISEAKMKTLSRLNLAKVSR